MSGICVSTSRIRGTNAGIVVILLMNRLICWHFPPAGEGLVERRQGFSQALSLRWRIGWWSQRFWRCRLGVARVGGQSREVWLGEEMAIGAKVDPAISYSIETSVLMVKILVSFWI